MPRFIIFVRATPSSETELNPDPKLLLAMSSYNASMVEAGILHLVHGLHRSSRDSTRIAFHDSGSPTLETGPFPADEIVSGFWIVDVKDLDEAVEWAGECPFGEGMVTEVRRIAEMRDFEGFGERGGLKSKERELVV